MKVWWALWETVELRIIGPLVLISQRINSSNMKEKAMLLLKKYLRIVKYPGERLVYLLARVSTTKYMLQFNILGGISTPMPRIM